MSGGSRPVHVIGAGPGGLATAAALRAVGIRSVVFDRADSVGASWRGHYDRLRLHTTRRLSALPGLPIPRSCGRWVHRDDMVRYLEDYAEHHRLEVATGVEVHRIERVAGGEGSADGQGHWLLRAGGGRELAAPVVVVATGYHHTPHVPDWPGRDAFGGELLHARHYRCAAPYAGRDVLVVGAGNTGAEIALDLVEGGAARVRLAVRTPPHVVRRSTAGWPAQATGIAVRRLPMRGRRDAAPVVDTGFVGAVRRRRIEPVAAVESFAGDKVRLADGGLIDPEVVVAATGYRRGLEELVGHLGVLDGRGLPCAHGRRTLPAAPGLHFTGYTTPVSGALRELALDARRIARTLARTTTD